MLDAPRPGPRKKRAYTRDACIRLYQTLAARSGLGAPPGFRHPDDSLRPSPDHPTPMDVLAGGFEHMLWGRRGYFTAVIATLLLNAGVICQVQKQAQYDSHNARRLRQRHGTPPAPPPGPPSPTPGAGLVAAKVMVRSGDLFLSSVLCCQLPRNQLL